MDKEEENLFDQDTNYKKQMKKLYRLAFDIKNMANTDGEIVKKIPNKEIYKKAISLIDQINELNYSLEEFAETYK
jgi:hypothetical protein